MYVCIHGHACGCMYVCMYVRMHVCMSTISWPGNFSKMNGAFQMPIEKPAQNRKMDAR